MLITHTAEKLLLNSIMQFLKVKNYSISVPNKQHFFVNPRLDVAIQKVVNISLKPFINSL